MPLTLTDQSIARLNAVARETQKILAEIRAFGFRSSGDRRDPAQKDYDEEQTGEMR